MPTVVTSFLLHSVTSVLSLLLPHFLHLPSLLLSSLHTYIHPDHLPSSSSSVPIRRPSDPNLSKPKPKSKPAFDESKAQLFRLSLSHSHLLTRLLFPQFHYSLLLLSFSLSNISLHFFLTHSSPLIPFLSSSFALFYLLFSLSSISLHSSFRSLSLRRFSLLSAILGFLVSIFVLAFIFSSFQFDRSKLPVSLLAGFIAWLIFSPAVHAARAFWIGTDQLKWDLAVVSCGHVNRFSMYAATIACFVVPLLWIDGVADAAIMSGFKKFRVEGLFGCGVLLIAVARANVQMYLNEAVLCWYQRLHLSRVPELDYGRAKVFLHNHYVCLAAVEFVVPAAMVMILVSTSQLKGNLFSGFFEVEVSDVVKECALFIAWWIVLVWGVIMMSTLALFRTGVLIVS